MGPEVMLLMRVDAHITQIICVGFPQNYDFHVAFAGVEIYIRFESCILRN